MNLSEIVQRAIEEDIGRGDITSLACIPKTQTCVNIISSFPGILAEWVSSSSCSLRAIITVCRVTFIFILKEATDTSRTIQTSL